MPSTPEPVPGPGPSARRFLLAMALGHLAGAYGFIVATFALAALSDLWNGGFTAVGPSSWGRLAEGVLAFPAVTGLLGLWTAVLMLPSTLVAAPVAWLAACRLRTDLPATAALGALVGLGPGLVLFRGGPVLDLRPFAAAAVAGAAFACVIWALCIRLRRAGGAVGGRSTERR